MTGHQTILRARMQGKRPADLVLVALISWVNPCSNPVVFAREVDLSADWRFLLDLDVCLIIAESSQDDAQNLWKEFAKVIYERAKPRRFYIADDESGEMQKIVVYRNPIGDDQKKWPVEVFTRPWGRWNEKGEWQCV